MNKIINEIIKFNNKSKNEIKIKMKMNLNDENKIKRKSLKFRIKHFNVLINDDNRLTKFMNDHKCNKLT